jgi:hypothetical protein
VTREATPATSHRLDLLVVQILPAVWADFNIETLILSDFDVQIISRNLTTVSHPLAESLNGFLLDRRFEAGAGCGCDSLVVFEETRELGDCISFKGVSLEVFADNCAIFADMESGAKSKCLTDMK